MAGGKGGNTKNTSGGAGGTGYAGASGSAGQTEASNPGSGGGGGGAGGGRGGDGGGGPTGVGGLGGAGGFAAGADGQAGGSSFYGGGGGGGGQNGGSGPFVSGQYIGGTGGRGGDSTGGQSAGGGGGAGGYGYVFSAGTFTNEGLIQGGNGGRGGNSPPNSFITGYGYGGAGGDGGGGAELNFGNVFINSGTVAGGNGGAGGTGDVLTQPTAPGGLGGVGIEGAGVTIVNSGSIAGGFSANGVQAAAINLVAGGTNRLTLLAGSTISGNVVGGGANDTLQLGGSSDSSFDASRIGTQYLGFEHLEMAGTGTWTLTGSTAAAMGWSASAGTLLVSGALTGATFDVASGATLGGSGTVGAVTIESGGTLNAGNSPGLLHTGSLSFTAGAHFQEEIGGATAGNGSGHYDQVAVTGTVALNGATLDTSLFGGFVARAASAYTIVDNDGTDAVIGTFAGLAEGAHFALGSDTFAITYSGGDGNDVVLTTVNQAPVLTVEAGLSYTEGAGPSAISPAATVVDALSPDFNGGSLTVSFIANGLAEDQLSILTDSTVSLAGGVVSVGGLAIGTVSGGSGGNALVVSFTSANATPSAVTTLLQHIGYSNTADPPSTDVRTVSFAIVDGDGTAFGGTDSASASTTISVSSVNEPPVNTVPGAQVVNEDTDLIFSAATGNQISIADPDANGGTMTVTLSVSHGAVTLGSTSALTFTAGHGNGTGSVIASGTVADLNAALATLTYRGVQDFNGSDTLTITTSDNGNTGSGGVLQDADTVAITVSSVNDAPVNSVPGAQAIDEDTGLVFSAANGNRIVIADADANGNDETVTLSILHGKLELASTAGLTSVSGDGGATVTLTGAIAAINAALDGLRYTSAPDFNGSDTLTISTNDRGNTGSGGAHQTEDTVSISVAAVNDAPVNTVPGAQTVNEDTSLVFSAANGNQLSIADVDASGGPMTVTLTASHGTVTLGTTSGVTFTAGHGNGTSSVIVTGTLADLNAALATLTYRSVQDFAGSDTLTITTSDNGNTGSGGAHQAQGTVSIGVTAVNDAPLIHVPGTPDIVSADFDLRALLGDGNGAFPVVVSSPLRVSFDSIALGDINRDGKLDVAVPVLGTNVLAVLLGDGQGGFSGQTIDIGGGLMPQSVALGDLNGDGKLDVVTANTFSHNVSILLGDGAGGFTASIAQIGSGSFYPNSVALGDVNGDGKLDIVTADQSDVSILLGDGTGGFTAGAFDSGNQPSSVALGDVNGDGKLDIVTANYTGDASILLGDGAGGFIARTAAIGGGQYPVSVALGDINNDGLLDVVTANYFSNDVSVLLGDGSGGFRASTVGLGGLSPTSVALGDLNDDGKLDIVVATSGGTTLLLGDGQGGFASSTPGPAFQTKSVAIGNVDNLQVVAGNADVALTGISITDVDANGAAEQLELSAQHGTLTLGSVSGLTFTGGHGNGTSSVIVTGTLADLNAALATLSYRGVQDFTGSDTLTIRVSDNDAALPKSTTQLIPISVAASTAPVAQDASATGDEDTTITGTLSATDPNNALLTFSRVANAAHGDVTVNPDGTFSYAPDPDFNGTDSFTFKTNDGSLDSNVATVNLSVSAVNDAPVANADALPTIAEDAGAQAIAFTALTGNDARGPATASDEAGQTLTVTGVSNAVGGTAQITGGHVEFTPTADFNGTASFDYTIQDNGTTNGAADPKTATGHASFTVTAVNDAPVNTLPAASLATAADVDFSIAGLSVADVDATSLTTVLQVDHGTLTVHAVGGAAVTGSGTASVTLTGTVAQIDAALAAANNVVYHSAADFNGTDHLTVTSSDGGGSGAGGPLSDVDQIAIDVSNHPGLFGPGDDTVTLPGPGSYSAGTGNDTVFMTASGETVRGGPGNDTYHVEASGDTVIENPGEGIDTVVTASLPSFMLPANVENLTHTGSSGFVGIGNELGNVLIGGGGSDYLIGLGGDDKLLGGEGAPDTLQGGTGNDVYFVESAGSSIVEFANEGIDSVQTWLSSYILANNVENLTHTGSADFVGVGNAGDNVLTGGLGNDYLIGGGGNDTMLDAYGLNSFQGGTGDDLYMVQQTTDTVIEFANEGNDTVETFLQQYALPTNVENLVFVGGSSHTGIGNAAANVITGSSGDDIFTGGGGNDVFNYRVSGNGLDTITDFNADNANTAEHDHIDLSGRGLTFASLAVTAVTGGVTVGIPGGDAIFLKGAVVGSIDAGDFFF